MNFLKYYGVFQSNQGIARKENYLKLENIKGIQCIILFRQLPIIYGTEDDNAGYLSVILTYFFWFYDFHFYYTIV